MELINKLVAVFVLSACLVISSLVLLSNKKSKVNIFFFVSGVLVTLWIGFGYIGLNLTKQILFLRLNFAAVSAFFIMFYFLMVYFPKTSEKRNYLIDTMLSITGGVFVILSIFTDKIISNIIYISADKPSYQMGSMEYPFYGYVLVLTAIIFFNLYKKYSKLNIINKSKVQFFLVGLIIWTLFNIIFNIVLPLFVKNGRQYYQYGDYSAIFFLTFIAYAISKHQLFNIKVIATEAIVIILSLVLFIQIFVASSANQRIVTFIVWFFASYGGYALVRSVKKEIQQKEEIQKLAEKLDKANQDLEELNTEKDNFMNMASHELNTPIAAISGYLSMILEEGMGGEIPAKAKTYLDSVYKSSRRLGALVRDLLDVSRIESGRIHLIYEQTQIEELIEQAVMEVGSKVKEANHTLTFEKALAPLPTTWLDRTRITEVIINLLGNSIKYTDPGGKIIVRAKQADGNIEVSVQDNGKGIPKDKHDRVFKKFTQVNYLKDEIKGSGLGMFISKNLVELHKGRIWFESEGEGKGTTFFFTLPIHKDKPYDEHEGEGAVLQLK